MCIGLYFLIFQIINIFRSFSLLIFVFVFSGVIVRIMLLSLHRKCLYSECSDPYFPAFGPNTERYGVSPNTDTFYAVYITLEFENGV